ncbi:hypothetical protein PSACC_01784 [Paramicrosporidium saccamoebae]|uniref:USP domain-containing protein n=1 Tax=Paramicrosporidium saccamoebae TaxID=1246581 RepID=A0A2H9TKW8_9FUNG|nr:hypothetical protein PSACC_01784 [Paramicrosporidium saccamoebae]
MFLVVLLAVVAAVYGAPVNLVNNMSHTCYITTALQNLFYIPPARSLVYTNSDGELPHSLAQLFAEMQTSSTAVSITSFYRLYIADSQQQDRPGAEWDRPEDPDIFFTKLVEYMVPILGKMFLLEVSRVAYVPVGGQLLEYKTLMEMETSSIQLFLYLDPGVSVEQALAETSFSQSMNITKPADQATVDRFEQAGFTQWGEQLDATVIKKTSAKGDMLVLQVRDNDSDGGSESSNVIYSDTMQVSGETFMLMGLIHTMSGHYAATVCTEASSDTWYHFDDVGVTKVDRSAALAASDNVFMLFYVRQCEWERWVADPTVYKPVIPPDVYASEKIKLDKCGL